MSERQRSSSGAAIAAYWDGPKRLSRVSCGVMVRRRAGSYVASTAVRIGALRIPNVMQQAPARGVEERLLSGHWEGLHQGGQSRNGGDAYCAQEPFRRGAVQDGQCGAQAALVGVPRQMKRLSAFLHQSLIYDRSSQIAQHEGLAERLKLTIWFCGSVRIQTSSYPRAATCPPSAKPSSTTSTGC